jgi:hypothetical protein
MKHALLSCCRDCDGCVPGADEDGFEQYTCERDGSRVIPAEVDVYTQVDPLCKLGDSPGAKKP